jgi:hypothetical protein
MKKKVRVITEREYEIDIPDHLLTPEYRAEFESYMFKLDSHPDALFEYVAQQLACHCPPTSLYIEGLGYAAWTETCVQGEQGKDAPIKYEEWEEDVETEIIK